MVGEELARIVSVQRPYNTRRVFTVLVCQRVECADESADAIGCVGLGLEEVDKLETRVVVYNHEHVLERAVGRSAERPGDVSVQQSTGVRWSVPGLRMA